MDFPDMAEPTSLDLTDANASDAVGLVSRALASKYSDLQGFCVMPNCVLYMLLPLLFDPPTRSPFPLIPVFVF